MDEQQRRTISRRQFLTGLGVGAGALVLAACGAQPGASGGASTAPTAGGAASTASGEVQFWDMVWGPPEYIDTAKRVAEQDFTAANPGITVSYQSNPWSSWPQVFTTAVGSGTAPDVSTGGGYQAIQFYPQDAILEIDDLVAEIGVDAFLPGQIDGMYYNGHYIALPWGIDIRIPFYRKDLFEQAGVAPPTTLEELRAALKALTRGEQYGIAFAGASPLGWQSIVSLMYMFGGGFFTADNQLDVMNERNIEGLTFVADLIKDGVVHPGSAGFQDADLSRAFGTGSAAVMFFSPSAEERVPEIKDQVGILSPMTGPHGDKATLMFANNLMIYKQTRNPDATKTFLKWWSENSLPIWTEGHAGNLPARRSIAADPYFQENPFIKPIIDEWVPVGRLTGNHSTGTFPALADIDAGGMLNTLATDLLQGRDVTETLQKLETTLKGLKSLQA